MRIHIFDNGLRSATGHHFDYCLRLARCLAQRGHGVSVWGAHGMQADVLAAFREAGCQPFELFSHFTHDEPALDADSARTLQALSLKATQELAQAGPADLNLFPTLTALQLAAWSGLEQAGPMVGLVHQAPQDEHPAGEALWSEATTRVHTRGLPVAVAAIDPLIASFMRDVSDGLPVFDWPMPLDGTPKPHYPPQIETIGFFGYQRLERGITLIPALTDALLGTGYQVLIHDTLGQFQPRAAITRLSVVNGFMRDLGPAMASCDLVVCTMQPGRYARRTSGIACMAVACGVPLVLPAGSLSATRYQALESVACYHEQTVQGVLDAVATSQLGYPRRCVAAQRAAMLWRQTQGVEKFVDAVLAALPSRALVAPP